MSNFNNLSDYNMAMLEDYEKHLRLKKKLPKTYFSRPKDMPEEEHLYNIKQRVIILFQFFFEKIMEWTPQDALNNLNEDAIQRAMLTNAYAAIVKEKKIYIPPFKKSDYFYLVKLCYPNEIHFGKQELAILRFKSVIEAGKSFPKGYFEEADGADNARIILQYALATSDIRFKNIEDLYAYFATSKTANSFLAKNKLTNACNNNFATPLEYMHLSLAPQQRDHFLYNYHAINELMRKEKIEMPGKVIIDNNEQKNDIFLKDFLAVKELWKENGIKMPGKVVIEEDKDIEDLDNFTQ